MEQEIEKSPFANYSRLISVGRNFLTSKKKLLAKDNLVGFSIKIRKQENKIYPHEGLDIEIYDFDCIKFLGEGYLQTHYKNSSIKPLLFCFYFFKVKYEKDLCTVKLQLIPKTIPGFNYVDKNFEILQYLEHKLKENEANEFIPKISPIKKANLYFELVNLITNVRFWFIAFQVSNFFRFFFFLSDYRTDCRLTFETYTHMNIFFILGQ